jgi:hypothetical protein
MFTMFHLKKLNGSVNHVLILRITLGRSDAFTHGYPKFEKMLWDMSGNDFMKNFHSFWTVLQSSFVPFYLFWSANSAGVFFSAFYLWLLP